MSSNVPLLKLFTLSALAGSTFAQNITQGLAAKAFSALPLGSVKPAGWLYDQLQVQSNGLAGRQHEFYRWVAQSSWTGGTEAYSNLEEAGSYWFNGLVANGYIADSAAIQNRTSMFLNFVLDHQDASGWLGPETLDTKKPRFLWGRYPFFFGATQMVEANPAVTDKVINSLYKFIQLANTMLATKQGLEVWGEDRWAEFAVTLQWLYENHPNGKEGLLMDTMIKLKETGHKWDLILSEQFFPKTAVEGLPMPNGFPHEVWHGVNVAQGLKASAVAYRFTHNQADIDAASSGWDRVFQYHGRPNGAIGADEYLAGLDAVRGTELCQVVELMFSGSVLYQIIGDLKFADRVERVAYNALPATLTGDMWSRQYLQQQNQITSRDMNPDPFPTDGGYSNVFGLEPFYPCCTVNFPQGWPKFVSNAFLVTPDQKSLVHIYLGPFSTTTTLADGNKVSVQVDTQYPFSDTLTTTITATASFTYYVRIPGWIKSGAATYSVNGGPAIPATPEKGLQAIQVAAGTTTFILDLPAEITTEARPNGSIAVHRGPFHYAFDIPRQVKVLSTNQQQNLAKDFQFDATQAWQYAINPDVSTMKFSHQSVDKIPSPVFDSGLPPLSISVSACLIDWPLTTGAVYAANPPQNPDCKGPATEITLRPYGSTKLRIGEFPTFKH